MRKKLIYARGIRKCWPRYNLPALPDNAQKHCRQDRGYYPRDRRNITRQE